MDRTAYKDCRLCPRHCGVDRTAGERGVCGESAECRVASIGPHFGEEPSFSGTRGSGTIFFTGCSCRCFFCQNYQISQMAMGDAYDITALVQAAERLARSGVHNINYVTPDHFWPHVRAVCEELRARGVGIPMLFNSSGYIKPEMVDEYTGQIDIFMPDFKFADPELAWTCMRDRSYPETALAALKRMVDAKGFLEPWDPSGANPARRGVLVRHLVLPGHADNSMAVLRHLHAEFGPGLPMSVMSQYHPAPGSVGQETWNRRLTGWEFRQVVDLVEELGFEHVYVQSMPDNSDFFPDFSRDEPFEGNRRQP